MRIDGANGLRVGGLGLEQPRATLVELGNEIGRERLERDALGPDAPKLAEREAQLRDGHREHIAIAVVKPVGQVEPREDVLGRPQVERRIDRVRLLGRRRDRRDRRRKRRLLHSFDARESARPEAHDAFDVLDVRPREQLFADGLESRPVLEVRVQSRRTHECRPRLGSLREAPREIEEGIACVGSSLEALER